MRRSHRHALIAAVLCSPALFPPKASACPAFLNGGALAPEPNGTRSTLRAFARSEDGAQWMTKALQVDPMNAKGDLLVPVENEKLAEKALEKHDRLSFRTEEFGPRYDAKSPFPCQADRLYEVQDKLNRSKFVYLAQCAPGTPDYPLGQPVKHDKDTRQIASSLFDYVYQPNNQLVFQDLNVRVPGAPRPYSGGAGADILLHLDVKKFFTMEFTNDNVQSFVESVNMGNVGMVGLINFYLKVLFFKIDLHMATVASWYDDSANLPMIMDVPMDAPKTTNPGSGLLFNWLPKDAVINAQDPRSNVPVANAKAILAGTKSNAQHGLSFCHGDPCLYRLAGKIGPKPFTIDMIVPKQLVTKGFYPNWVTDLAQFKVDAEWDDEPDEDLKGRVAMYFETSGLPKGQYKMDYWIRMGEAPEGQASCPKPVTVTGVLPPPSPVPIAH